MMWEIKINWMTKTFLFHLIYYILFIPLENFKYEMKNETSKINSRIYNWIKLATLCDYIMFNHILYTRLTMFDLNMFFKFFFFLIIHFVQFWKGLHSEHFYCVLLLNLIPENILLNHRWKSLQHSNKTYKSQKIFFLYSSMRKISHYNVNHRHK